MIIDFEYYADRTKCLKIAQPWASWSWQSSLSRWRMGAQGPLAHTAANGLKTRHNKQTQVYRPGL